MFNKPRTEPKPGEYNRIDAQTWEEKMSAIGQDGQFVMWGKSNPLLSSKCPWILSTIFFALLSFILLFSGGTSPPEAAAEMRSSSEPAQIISHLKLEARRFISSADYVGVGTNKKDAAWQSLGKDHTIVLTDEEAQRLWGPDHGAPRGSVRDGYPAEIEMFHSLNCLDTLRRALQPAYQYPNTTDASAQLDYCIDHLRQTIQCHGDMTVFPIYANRFKALIADTAVTRSCRTFAPLREWTSIEHRKGVEMGLTHEKPTPNGELRSEVKPTTSSLGNNVKSSGGSAAEELKTSGNGALPKQAAESEEYFYNGDDFVSDA